MGCVDPTARIDWSDVHARAAKEVEDAVDGVPAGGVEVREIETGHQRLTDWLDGVATRSTAAEKVAQVFQRRGPMLNLFFALGAWCAILQRNDPNELALLFNSEAVSPDVAAEIVRNPATPPAIGVAVTPPVGTSVLRAEPSPVGAQSDFFVVGADENQPPGEPLASDGLVEHGAVIAAVLSDAREVGRLEQRARHLAAAATLRTGVRWMAIGSARLARGGDSLHPLVRGEVAAARLYWGANVAGTRVTLLTDSPLTRRIVERALSTRSRDIPPHWLTVDSTVTVRTSEAGELLPGMELDTLVAGLARPVQANTAGRPPSEQSRWPTSVRTDLHRGQRWAA